MHFEDEMIRLFFSCKKMNLKAQVLNYIQALNCHTKIKSRVKFTLILSFRKKNQLKTPWRRAVFKRLNRTKCKIKNRKKNFVFTRRAGHNLTILDAKAHVSKKNIILLFI